MESQFDTVVAAYEHSMEEMPFREHIEAYSFLNAVGDVGGRGLLDLGCGSGLHTRLPRSQGVARVVGMDESTAMVDYARRKEEREGLGVEYLTADAADPAAVTEAGSTGRSTWSRPSSYSRTPRPKRR